jgi:hypothetical protein
LIPIGAERLADVGIATSSNNFVNLRSSYLISFVIFSFKLVFLWNYSLVEGDLLPE